MGETQKFGCVEPATLECMSLITYHDLTMVIAVGVMLIVGFFSAFFLFPRLGGGYSCRNLTSHNKLEIFWTTSPGFILSFLAYLSWVNLYAMEGGAHPDYHAKVIGHQWYWDYEYFVDMTSSSVSAYKLPGEPSFSFSRSGSSDEVFLVPVEKTMEVGISTSDVIHSWGVPALGVKMDAIPGRVNRVSIEAFSVGMFSGNCYELCGYGHSVMPVNLMVLNEDSFVSGLVGGE
uniref:cytochrome c oxidase subunit II n=1 Tax=Xylonora corona TaxID=2939326 RepID=UPI00202874E9|nr:cytochrome c oxidase subunit II [Xylonora corona]UPX88869.1 cytochrome c oxidase subunit 2 [Xylonora corona]